jgi:hypothetical protein
MVSLLIRKMLDRICLFLMAFVISLWKNVFKTGLGQILQENSTEDDKRLEITDDSSTSAKQCKESQDDYKQPELQIHNTLTQTLCEETKIKEQFSPQKDLNQNNSLVKAFFHIHNRFYLALLDSSQAELISRHVLNANYMVLPLTMTNVDEISARVSKANPAAAFSPAFLGDLLKFDDAIGAVERRRSRMKLVFQTGSDPKVQVQMAFMLGCHMIMSHGVGFEETCLAFKNLHTLFAETGASDEHGVSMRSCWRAICCAKALSWIDLKRAVFTNRADDRCIQIDEYLHYARYETCLSV